MDAIFLTNNTHIENPTHFVEADPHLSKLKQLPTHVPKLLEQLPFETPGIYTLVGTYQTGKTTLLKQWMAKLLSNKIPAPAIVFFSGEHIENDQTLLQLIETQLAAMPQDRIRYVIIDDVTTITKWYKAISVLANIGWLNQVVLILSSTTSLLREEAQAQLIKQRGTANMLDYQLYPLTFRESVLLKNKNVLAPEMLYDEFNNYLLHGGYLPAINDMLTHGKILDSTLKVFSDRICKDIVKYGKRENYLREILVAIIKHYHTPTTWNALAQELSINHPKTIGDYIAQLESMDIVFTQSALLEKSLQPAPKKARKLLFTDPFMFHATRAWLTPIKNFYASQIQPILTDVTLSSQLVETAVISHYRRYYPTYYIKAEGETSLAYVYNQYFWPIQITWMNPLRAKDLKQILKYPNSRILTKTLRTGIIEHIKTEPLPLALITMEET